ncbi:MAG: hypothetical protein K2Y37_03395 [Pirellulales bacterium]|nr:hypothetical protein [Pirellulales bacterium]
MTTAARVESRIYSVEGFNVVIRGDDGHDIKGNRQGFPQFDYKRAAKDDMTVEAWKSGRFRTKYPGFHVDVLNAANQAVPGNTKLGTIRQTYRT